jgi:hypothetical protein
MVTAMTTALRYPVMSMPFPCAPVGGGSHGPSDMAHLRTCSVGYRDSCEADVMHFEEIDAADGRMHADAVKRSRHYSQVAAVVVLCVRGRLPRQQTYRSENLSDRYALAHAVKTGKDFASGRVAICRLRHEILLIP